MNEVGKLILRCLLLLFVFLVANYGVNNVLLKPTQSENIYFDNFFD